MGSPGAVPEGDEWAFEIKWDGYRTIVHVADGRQGRGVGATMLLALFEELRKSGATRVDCGCHRENAPAWRFYERLGFRPLDEERIACLL